MAAAIGRRGRDMGLGCWLGEAPLIRSQTARLANLGGIWRAFHHEELDAIVSK